MAKVRGRGRWRGLVRQADVVWFRAVRMQDLRVYVCVGSLGRDVMMAETLRVVSGAKYDAKTLFKWEPLK